MAGGRLMDDLISLSLSASSLEDIERLCGRICERFDFQHFMYAVRFPTSFVKPFFLVVSGYPTEWRDRYEANGYLNIDPTVAHCMDEVLPLTWDQLAEKEASDKTISAFMEQARTFGLVSGVTLPIHGSAGEVGMLSLCGSESVDAAREHIREVLPDIHLLAVYVHQGVCGLADTGLLPFSRQQLTQREKECLLWAAEGKTSWETAQILGISERTVIFHLQNVSEKLGVSNRQQAVARAISQRLIAPLFR